MSHFRGQEQKCQIGCTRENEALESQFPKLLTFSEYVESLSRNHDPKVTQNLHVFAICCRPEIDNDVISGVAVDNVGMDVPIKFGDSGSNRFRDIRGADFVTYERTNEN